MDSLDVRTFTVGQLQENCYLVRRKGAANGILIDPGDEAQRLIDALGALGVAVDAILLTHTHFDHVGAVAALARHTGAPVYCPSLERAVLADIDASVSPLGLSGFESYEADEMLAGGEHLELAGLEIDVHFTPGHSPGHLTYALPAHEALLVGDVLFRGSVGRVDLPGGDWATLLDSIAGLVDAYPPQTLVFPGHGPHTTLGVERETNPFLIELAAR
jgi:glyoxylase-like metal-dependent hydrolase (beta-lactamase superfamily II)